MSGKIVLLGRIGDPLPRYEAHVTRIPRAHTPIGAEIDQVKVSRGMDARTYHKVQRDIARATKRDPNRPLSPAMQAKLERRAKRAGS